MNQPPVPDGKGIQDILVGIGTLVQEWNTAEKALKVLLQQVAGGGDTVRILCAHMSPNEVCDALVAFSQTAHVADGLREPIQLVVQVFQRMQPYRNYYVHEPVRGFLIDVGKGRTSMSAVGEHTRKGGVARFSEIKSEDLRRTRTWCIELSVYISWIVGEVISRYRGELGGAQPDPPTLPPPWQHPSVGRP